MSTDCFTPRRSFLKTCLLGSTAALAAKAAPSAAPTATGKFTSRVSLTAGEDRADIAFKALEPFKKVIADAIGNKRVIVKPNNVIIDRPLCASHADNLEGILEFLMSIGKKNVAIAESPANGSAVVSFTNYGYNKFAGKYGVKLIDLDTEDFAILHCIDQKDFRPHPCRVSKLMLDPNNFIISAAKLKTHDLVGITLSLKNIVVGAPIKDPGAGLRPGGARGGKSDKPLTHGGGSHGINYNLFALSPKLHPHLAVIDGYEGMEGTGPVNGTPVNHRVCVASMDWLAADRVGAELMGVDAGKIGYLTYCIEAGDRGEGDLSKIEILGPAIKDHARTYQLPKTWDQIITWQQPA
ncbi:MAG TPA: DUF362 domain-containing protein [Bryobacteraceae bacterium]|nr:DUF362 domain-containing protein [Bryobacteraceae bacterium]